IRRKLAASAYSAEEEIISVNRITDYEPELTRCESGYYFPTEGCIDNQKLLPCLTQDLAARGVDFHSVMVQEISAHTIVTESSRQTFDWVLDCRGLAAKNHFADLRGVRGELVMVQAAEVHLQR